MPLGVKLFFTIAIVVIGALIYFLESAENGVGPDWLWRFGKNDPFRNLLYRSDGSARRYMKTCIFIIFVLLLLTLWALVPTIQVARRSG